MREELSSRKLAGEENLTIRRGKIVKMTADAEPSGSTQCAQPKVPPTTAKPALSCTSASSPLQSKATVPSAEHVTLTTSQLTQSSASHDDARGARED